MESLIAVLLALIGGGLALYTTYFRERKQRADYIEIFEKALRDNVDSILQVGPDKAVHNVPASTQMLKVIDSLRRSAQEMDSLMKGLHDEAIARSSAMAELEERLAQMLLEEKTTAERLEHLKSLEPEQKQAIAQIFHESLAEEGKRSGKRDYFLFAAGVVTSILLQLLFETVF